MGKVEYSQWDSEHFGIKIGRYVLGSLQEVPNDVEQAKMEGYDLLITRVPTEEVNVVNALEDNCFRIKDTLVRYKIDLKDITPLKHEGKVQIRMAEKHDLNAIKTIARHTFKEYAGHFHNDKLLGRKKCDDLYVKWSENSLLDRNIAQAMFIAEEREKILGFATMRHVSKDESEGVLFATSPQARERGIYSEFIKEAINWSKRNKYKHLLLGTNINNYIIKNIWTGFGANIYASYYTMHLWMDD